MYSKQNVHGTLEQEIWNSAGIWKERKMKFSRVLDLTGGFRIDNPSGCKLYLAEERGIHFENLFQ